MRVVIVGASGNIGTSLLTALADETGVDSVLAVARRRPSTEFSKTEWAEADIREDDLQPLFRGADAVVHLAWAIQPSRNQEALGRTNILGSQRLFWAVAESGVPALVYASSVGTLLRRTEGSTCRRELAARGHPDELLRAPQGGGGAAPRPV
jgi:UDP-glucose 4-epimerase